MGDDIKIDKIIRSKRRSIGLEITREALLVVRAPKSASMAAIDRVVIRHKNWIRKKQIYVQDLLNKSRPREFVNGEEFYYLGQRYKLNIVDGAMVILRFDNGYHLSSKYQPQAKQAFIKLYKTQAHDHIYIRVEYYSALTGLKSNHIGITNAQTRWGSCSAKGNLCFSWRLIMAPPEVIDYVIIHELVHIAVKNHSKIFWAKVAAIMPEYQKCRQWLKDNGHLLNL